MIRIMSPAILCVIGLLKMNYCIGQNNSQQHPSRAIVRNDSAVLKERVMLKNYAFCLCLIQQSPNDSLLRHDGSLSAYQELGSYSEKAYVAIDSFVARHKFEKYRSINGAPLSLMKCLDLYNSKTLRNLILACDKYMHVNKNSF
jgi:hypothetical protein